MKNLTLIIPAKAEADSLPNVLEEIKNFDCSCFNGEYITGGVDEEFLQNLHKTR